MGIDMIEVFPFMLRVSKHAEPFSATYQYLKFHSFRE